MINPNDTKHRARLGRAWDRSRYLLQPFRKNAFYLIQQIAGSHYSDSGAQQRVVVNALQQAATIFLRLLMPHEPRAMITAYDPALRPLALDMEAWMKRAAREMRLHATLRACVFDALTGLGIAKIGEAYHGDVEIGGFTQHVGQPFVEPVGLDDWNHDMSAKRQDQWQYAGNSYRVRLEEARETPYWDKDAREALHPQETGGYNDRGDLKVQTLSQTSQSLYDADIEDYCEVIDCWLPREKLILTIQSPTQSTSDFGGFKPLAINQWNGPQEGPYALLTFLDITNNSMPVPPMSSMRDLHELLNVAWRKLAEQLIAQKEVLAYSGSAVDDAKRLQDASNGDAVLVNLLDKMRSTSWGGIKPENLAAADRILQLFDKQAGNLSLIGGLGAQSPTLGQDEMLNRNASAQVVEMQERVISFTRDVMTRMGWHWWSNPYMVYEDTRELHGEQVPVSITPTMRQIPFNRFNWDIDPYSLGQSTPEMKLAGVKETLAMLAPFMGMAAQQGVTFDFRELVKAIARYRNNPEIANIVKIGPPPEMQGPQQIAGEEKERVMPPNTTRTQVRENRPMMTDDGHNKMMQQLMAASSNGNQ